MGRVPVPPSAAARLCSLGHSRCPVSEARGRTRAKDTSDMRALAFVCALAVLAAGCSRTGSSGGAGGRHAWTQPGVLRIAVTQEPKSLNPLLATTTTDVFVDRLMFEP